MRYPADNSDEARTLKIVLAINAAMFAGEAIGALLADSSALLADSLDMFADAAVYGIALFGVHRAHATQLKAARVSGGRSCLSVRSMTKHPFYKVRIPAAGVTRWDIAVHLPAPSQTQTSASSEQES